MNLVMEGEYDGQYMEPLTASTIRKHNPSCGFMVMVRERQG